MLNCLSCRWCHTLVEVGTVLCPECHHEAHRPRRDCRCPDCVAQRTVARTALLRPYDAPEEHEPNPYDGTYSED